MPNFVNKGNKYLFSWNEYFLQAEVSRINVNHESTRCQLIFTSLHPDAEPHILQTRFNLESARTRSELAKEMAIRYKIKEQIDWKNLIEYLSVKTIREFEKGEPVIKLTSNDAITPLEYLIYPIAPLNKPTVLFGPPGSGKSQLLVALNMVIALPWVNNPLRLIPPKKPIVALFCDYEADPEDIRRQLVSLTKGMGLDWVELHYRRCSLPLADDIEAVRNHIEEIGATCLFVDSMSLAAGEDLNAMKTATSYFRTLRNLKDITSISLAHTSKEKETKYKTIIGSVLWEAGARSVWEVRGEEDEDTFNIGLFHRKSNLSKKSLPLAFQLTYENNLPVNITWHDPKSVPEFVERMNTSQRILSTLKRGKVSSEDLVKLLDTKRNTIDAAVSRLSHKNLITGDSRGWGLPLL